METLQETVSNSNQTYIKSSVLWCANRALEPTRESVKRYATLPFGCYQLHLIEIPISKNEDKEINLLIRFQLY